MRAELVAWGVAALVLIAAETMVPGAFLMWLGFAAATVFLLLVAVPGMPILLQALLFVVLGFLYVWVYRNWFRGKGRSDERPELNRRAQQIVGHVATLQQPIIDGEGRVQIADAFWNVEGPDLPVGTRVRVVGVHGMTLKVEAAA